MIPIKNTEIITAFVLINCKSGYQSQTADELREIKNVIDVTQVNGPYDIIVTVEDTSLKGLREIITWKIRTLSNISSTLTMTEIPKD